MSRLVTRHLVLLHMSSKRSVAQSKPKALPSYSRRTYATHQDHSPSSLLSQQFEQRKTSRNADSVGPFQLGIVQPSTQKVKKWSELSNGGKGAAPVSSLWMADAPKDFPRQYCALPLERLIFQLFLLEQVSLPF